MALLENWQKWTNFLGANVMNAEATGMSKKAIQSTAFEIGSYLAKNVDPKNEQERVLSDLWSVASENEQHALANMVVKLVQQKTVH
ncbi:DUF3243 domain-containing protein [Paenisporosarcina indica]|uniref:DUF3243 domain-containing protein n=1 Tax=Paenisporosarcina indica TaxID=650093 RepID=UPI00094FB1E8|nr:DUF3243 domain-containing protein [Paenisporosarcina indica]